MEETEWLFINNRGYILIEAIGALVLLSIFCAFIFPSFMTIQTSLERMKEEREIMAMMHDYMLLNSGSGEIEYKYTVHIEYDQGEYCATWGERKPHEICFYD